jgi:hypothetical protein
MSYYDDAAKGIHWEANSGNRAPQTIPALVPTHNLVLLYFYSKLQQNGTLVVLTYGRATHVLDMYSSGYYVHTSTGFCRCYRGS